MKRLFSLFLRLYETWWIWGIAGWLLVYLNYPFADVLPAYAE